MKGSRGVGRQRCRGYSWSSIHWRTQSEEIWRKLMEISGEEKQNKMNQ